MTIKASQLRASHVLSPFAAGPRDTVVASNGHTFHVAKGHDSKSGYYYTILCGDAIDKPWTGYRLADSIDDVRRIIRSHS